MALFARDIYAAHARRLIIDCFRRAAHDAAFHQRAVERQRVEPVRTRLLARHFPIAGQHEPLRRTEQLKAVIGATEKLIHVIFDVAQKLIERRSIDIPSRENLAAIKMHTRLFQAERFLVDIVAVHFFAFNRRADKVAIVEDEATGETILEIEVRGKRGIGFCKSMPSAVRPYERLLNRPKPVQADSRREKQRRRREGLPQLSDEQPPLEYPDVTDPVFPGNHVRLFNGVLARAKLKRDRDEKSRTAYSLRHTYICMRLMEGADIYQIAKNRRTSVEMIEKFYAAHIKSTLDAASINVRRPKPMSVRKQSAT